MSDQDTIPDGRVAQLRYSLSNLLHEFGSTESAGFGLVVNLGLTALGATVWAVTDGIVAVAGAVWALIHVFAIIKWVIES